MSANRPTYTPRGYQEYILQQIAERQQNNLLLELDCGLGKRFITHQIVASKFPDKKILIVVHSSSSLAETMDYLRSEYGGLDEELGELSSRIPSGKRRYVLKAKRVIVATPQVLAGLTDRMPEEFRDVDLLIINEVDTLTRRSGGRTALVFPWLKLLRFFSETWIIGMSGTLRDDHAVFGKEQLEIRNELETLKRFIKNSELISMNELFETDIGDYLEPTLVKIERVTDLRIRSISLVLDELIRNNREEILVELSESGNLHLVNGDARRVHLLLERLPVSDDLKGRYSALLMLRKYVYAMPPKQFLRMFYGDYVKHYFNVSKLRRVLPETSSKTTHVLKIAKRHSKTLVLTSYLEMVEQIRDTLTRSGLGVAVVTGQTRNKDLILKSFRESDEVDTLVMSPVGERDLDLPQAEVMVVCDSINTTKTMYQKFKRTRGGLVLLLTYAGTSEERKVRRLLNQIIEKYPWSTAIVDSDSERMN